MHARNSFRLFVTAALTLLLTACMTGGQRVTDFSDKSVVYGWLDIKEIDANRLHSVVIYQHKPVTDKPYYNVKVKKFEGGYLYYAFSFANGAYRTSSATGQKCLGPLCNNTIYSYDFGKQGDSTAVVLIDKPDVYNLGSYELQEVKTGFFSQGKFDAVPATKPPTERSMLNEMLKDAEGKPDIIARIERALQRL